MSQVVSLLTGLRPLRLVVVALLLVSVAFLIEDQLLVRFSVWLIFGMLALSLALIWSRAGIFSFGQNAFFGVSAYLYGIVAINFAATTGETLTAFLLAAIGGGLFALLLGYFLFYGRLHDVYVAIITLAVTLVLFTVMAGTAGPQYRVGQASLGGYNGMTGIPPITLGLPGLEGVRLGPQLMYIFIAVLAVGLYAAVSFLIKRPFGRVIAAIRENELRTELLGYDVRRYKLAVFAIGGGIAGVAGAAFAAWGLFINPAVFGLRQAALVVIWLLVGGQRSLAGPFLGAAVVEGISTTLGGGGAGGYTPVILGAVLIAVVLLLPGGVAGLYRLAADRLAPTLRRAPAEERPSVAAPVPEAPPPTVAAGTGARVGEGGAVLVAGDLKKSFGGVRALDGVSLQFPALGIHCLIGPNGAGKSTFFNLLVGRFRPTSGRIFLGGEDITRLPPYRRARRGIGMKLQVPSLYPGLRVRENVWLACYAASRDVREADGRADDMLSWVGLAHRAGELAGNLSHGEQQWLEIGMTLAASPRIILLDEPTAGMTREETHRTIEIVRRLAETASVVVVEHDMQFVRHMGAPITVFHQGRVFAQGTLEEIRRDTRVLDVYLGRDRRVAVE